MTASFLSVSFSLLFASQLLSFTFHDTKIHQNEDLKPSSSFDPRLGTLVCTHSEL
jgi:hypothetical protein